MPSWINRLIEFALGPVRALATAVRDKLSGLWSTLAALLTTMGRQWGRLQSAFNRARWTIRHIIDENYRLFWRLVKEWIPRFVSARIASLSKYLAQIINQVESSLKKAISSLTAYFHGRINEIAKWLEDLKRWAGDEISSLRSRWQWLTKEVIPRVTSPSRLAEWLAGALLTPLWRAINPHLEAYTEWLIRNSVRIILKNIGRIERFIARVF